MSIKKLALAAVLAATASGYAGAADLPVKALKAAPEIPFFFVNQNWLSYGYQFTATDPGVSTTAKHTVDFIHFDVWAYGVNFFDIQWLKSDSRDPVGGGLPNSGPAGETEIYGLVRSSFGWNQIFNTKMFSVGPLTNISFEVGGDGNTANGGTLPAKRDFVAGLDFSFMLPYKGHLDVSPLYYKEWNHNQFTNFPAGLNPSMDTNFNATWAVEANYEMPLGFLPDYIPLVFSGRSAFYGPKGNGSAGQANTKTEFNSEQRLTLDVGKMAGARPGFYSVYAGYRYWKNKFGIDPTAGAGTCCTVESSWVTGATVEF
jgi:hypothetical protein